ncbi:MAG: hypothetical protein U1D69_12145 [Polynucleobacter sp.]|nr:hypothetical protein [Limnobacter sp.]MDP3273430.1 hypothetical protein [Limnobacter sp.]MDZ4057688.1 hypothetical protein [Polynucleobacter sp.]
MDDREQWQMIKRRESENNLVFFIFSIGLTALIICGFFAVDFLIGVLK